MVIVARIYLFLILVLFGLLGLASLAVPDAVAARMHLAPQAMAGTAEIRGLYGGAFLAWSLMIIGAWRYKPLAKGLLAAVGLSMGLIAAARMVSLAIDHEAAFNIPAAASEALIALACWVLYRNEKPA
jgi:hypothetical protein